MLLDANPCFDANGRNDVAHIAHAHGGFEQGYRRLTNKAVSKNAGQQPKTGPQTSADTPDFVAMMLAVQSQDRGAFANIFQHFAPRVKGFLMKSGSDGALAEELAQDVMATVWHKAAQFDPARASVATWIFTIARNRRIDHFRRTRRPEPESLDWGPESEPDQADIYEAGQETRLLAAAIEKLPAPQRALIQSAFFGDLSHGEIAAQTGLPLGTIKSRIRLALERLRSNLNRD